MIYNDMSLWRIFLLWLVMVTIPLEGMAASSMLLCGLKTHHGHVEQTVSVQSQAHSATAGHDHAKHGHAKALPESTSGKSMPDATHDCGACGACCHNTAIAEIPCSTALQPMGQTMEAEPFVFVLSPPVRVPDKPPRV